MKHVQKMMLVPEHLLQSLETEHRLTSPLQFATLTRLDQNMKQIMESLLPEDQKISWLDQLFHRYQGLSRQIKTEATVKPTVLTNVTPAPTEASPTTAPTTSLGKSAKVRMRTLPVTPRLSTSKIPRPVGTASPSIPTPQSIPTSQSVCKNGIKTLRLCSSHITLKMSYSKCGLCLQDLEVIIPASGIR